MQACSRIRSSVTLIVLALCAGVLAARGQQKPPSFGSRVVLVPIDVRVLDVEGKPVTGLSADEFVVTEDGVRQRISHFEAYSLEPDLEPVAVPALRMRAATPAAEIVPQDYRVFLIVLGRGRQNEPSKGPEAMARFIRERLLPQDRVAILAWWNRATDFTADHVKIAQVLDRFKVAHEAIEVNASRRLRDLGVTDGDPSARLSAPELRSWVFAGSASKSVTTAAEARAMAGRAGAAVWASVGDEMQRNAAMRPVREPTQARAAASPAALDTMTYEDFEMLFVSFDRYVAEMGPNTADLSAILTGIDYLRRVEGEKHLIFMAERPLYLGRVEDDRSIAAMASDARIVLHMVQTGGVPGPLPAATFAEGFERTADKVGPTATQLLGLATLRTLSELTGGLASTMDYADRALARIEQASRGGYLIGYYPSNSTWDGTFRRINVGVNRKGARVLFRHGYFAKDVPKVVDRRADFAFNRIAGAAATPYDNRSIRITVESANATRTDAGGLEATVVVNIDMSALEFAPHEDRRVAALDITLFCGDATDNLVGELWQKADSALKPGTHQRLQREGFRREFRVPLKAPGANVKVIVYQYATDRVGSVTARLRAAR